MCIMLSQRAKPSDTVLVLIPLKTVEGQPQSFQLVYLNSMDVGREAGLMVVPIPNPHGLGEEDLILSAVDAEEGKRIQQGVRAACKPYYKPPVARGMRSRGMALNSRNGSKHSRSLVVQEIGAYRMSMAPSLRDLEERAPWDRFRIPIGHVEPILADMRAQYPEGFAFAIAEAREGVKIKGSGFGVVYADDRPAGAFLPSAHEVQASGLADMDVSCLAINCIMDPRCMRRFRSTAALKGIDHQAYQVIRGGEAEAAAAGGGGEDEAPAGAVLVRQQPRLGLPAEPVGEPALRVPDEGVAAHGLDRHWASVRQVARLLPTRGAGELHGEKAFELGQPTIATAWSMLSEKQNCVFSNANITGRLARPEDIAAAAAVLERAIATADGSAATFASEGGARIDLALTVLAHGLGSGAPVPAATDAAVALLASQ